MLLSQGLMTSQCLCCHTRLSRHGNQPLSLADSVRRCGHNWLSYGPVTPHSLSCLFVILSLNIITMIAAILLVSGAASLVSTGPTIYKLDEERNIAESILTPVSSTGINNMKTF